MEATRLSEKALSPKHTETVPCMGNQIPSVIYYCKYTNSDQQIAMLTAVFQTQQIKFL
jgi:hypothetical protein